MQPIRYIDISGRKFGKTTAVRPSGKNSGGQQYWLCQCECGSFHVSLGRNLRSGLTKSCGCLTLCSITKHGYIKGGKITPEYRAWAALKNRCTNPQNRAYKHYGGRGITVCDRWTSDKGFENFISDMGTRPSELHSIDRKNNDKGYSPDNCKWATEIEQHQNKRSNKKITCNGETLVMGEWARRLEMEASTLRKRLLNGVSLEEMIENPRQTYYNR